MIKKLLVSLIVAAMLVTLVPMAALAEETTTTTTTTEETTTAEATAPTVPYSDIFGTPFESVFIKLHLMGIFTGYPDQTFKPDRPVTRSEFLAVTIRALNFEKYVAGFKGATKYPDTAIDHWATGYINMGTAFGIIKGYPDGTFKPDANVSYAEACTMLVRMLGYTQYLTPVTPGGGTEDWFANFVKMAVAMGDPAGYGLNVHAPDLVLPDGLLTGVTAFNASSPASRGDLAVMVYNSLFVYPLTQWEWSTDGPVPGGTYFPSNTTLIGAMGFHEMETFVTDAPPYDVYAGASQLELFEGWTTVVNNKEVFLPCFEDPQAFAAANGLKYPKDFKPVHRLYDIPAASIWVGGKPADLTTMIGKPVRVIYQGPVPYVGQDPFKNPSKLWYVRTLNHVTENYKVAANKVPDTKTGHWFPGKTVGEIYADLKLNVYHPTTIAKSASKLPIDPRAVIFLEDTLIENPNVMLVKDADITVIRGVAEAEFYKDYEGHLYSAIVVSNQVWSILAKVWPGHVVKDVQPAYADSAVYDKWGRVVEFGTLGFSYTDDNTFNKRLPTPYPTEADFCHALVEDNAKFVLGGEGYTNWNWYAAYSTGFSALDWFMTKYYPVGTVKLAPVKNLNEESTFSVVRFEGNEAVQSGKLEDIYRAKDQWGNDWITAVKLSGKVYEVLFPGRGEFPVIAAYVTPGTVEPVDVIGQVGAVESGATFLSTTDEELVFNNLWDEREDWIGQPVDLCLNPDGKVRYMKMASAASAAAAVDYGLVTRVNMVTDSSGYHLSLDVMKGDGSVVNYPLTEVSATDLMLRVYYPPYGDKDYNLVPYEASMGKVIVAKFSCYNDHNRGAKEIINAAVKVTDYNSIYAIWQKLQNLVRDLIKITKDSDGNNVFFELATNPGQYQSTNTEGMVDEVGRVFDGTSFSLENTNREQLVWNFPAAFWKPEAVSSDKTAQWLAAKDVITVPWEKGTTQQPGTVIYDATLPAPNVPTPDGNILIKKMADLQREQFVQVFFQPAFEPANPYMCDWMLVNGQYVPVVKFIVIRPLMAGPLVNVADSPTGLVDPPVNEIYKQFNQSLDTARSTMWVYQTLPAASQGFLSGTISFRTKVYPNDTIVFTPKSPLLRGSFLVNVTGYDAATGGTQTLNHYWNFEIKAPVLTTLLLEPATATLQLPDQTSQSYTITAKDQYGNVMEGITGTIATTFGTLSKATFTTNASGQDTFSASSSVAGEATISVASGGVFDTASCYWLAPPTLVTIKGTVTYYGNPAAGGTITVKDGATTLATTPVGADGKYQCTFDLFAAKNLNVHLYYLPAGSPPPPPWEDDKTVAASPGGTYTVDFSLILL